MCSLVHTCKYSIVEVLFDYIYWQKIRTLDIRYFKTYEISRVTVTVTKGRSEHDVLWYHRHDSCFGALLLFGCVYMSRFEGKKTKRIDPDPQRMPPVISRELFCSLACCCGVWRGRAKWPCGAASPAAMKRALWLAADPSTPRWRHRWCTAAEGSFRRGDESVRPPVPGAATVDMVRQHMCPSANPLLVDSVTMNVWIKQAAFSSVRWLWTHPGPGNAPQLAAYFL